jgi:hypothetical protein
MIEAILHEECSITVCTISAVARESWMFWIWHIHVITRSDTLDIYKCNKKKNSVAFSPQANYTDWAIATCRRNLVPTFVDRGVSRGQRGGSPTVVNLSFLDQIYKCNRSWKVFSSGTGTQSCQFHKIMHSRGKTVLCHWGMWPQWQYYNKPSHMCTLHLETRFFLYLHTLNSVALNTTTRKMCCTVMYWSAFGGAVILDVHSFLHMLTTHTDACTFQLTCHFLLPIALLTENCHLNNFLKFWHEIVKHSVYKRPEIAFVMYVSKQLWTVPEDAHSSVMYAMSWLQFE